MCRGLPAASACAPTDKDNRCAWASYGDNQKLSVPGPAEAVPREKDADLSGPCAAPGKEDDVPCCGGQPARERLSPSGLIRGQTRESVADEGETFRNRTILPIVPAQFASRAKGRAGFSEPGGDFSLNRADYY